MVRLVNGPHPNIEEIPGRANGLTFSGLSLRWLRGLPPATALRACGHRCLRARSGRHVCLLPPRNPVPATEEGAAAEPANSQDNAAPINTVEGEAQAGAEGERGRGRRDRNRNRRDRDGRSSPREAQGDAGAPQLNEFAPPVSAPTTNEEPIRIRVDAPVSSQPAAPVPAPVVAAAYVAPVVNVAPPATYPPSPAPVLVTAPAPAPTSAPVTTRFMLPTESGLQMVESKFDAAAYVPTPPPAPSGRPRPPKVEIKDEPLIKVETK